MRYLRVVIVLGALAVVIGGRASGSGRTAAADAQVETGGCQSSGVDGHAVSQSCSFVLSDGQRFRCPQTFTGPTPTAGVLAHTKGCVRLRSLVLSPAERRMIATLNQARSCLSAKGQRALGGPVLPPNPTGSISADGELVIGRSAAHIVFIAFYIDAARAQRLQARLMRNARRVKGQVERHGTVTVLWIHPPSGVRAAVRTCALA